MMYKREIIYVAARLSSPTPEGERKNRERAMGYVNFLRAKGLVVYSPHEAGASSSAGLSNSEWLEHCLEHLSRCDQCHVLLDSDETPSPGVAEEIQLCAELKKPIRMVDSESYYIK